MPSQPPAVAGTYSLEQAESDIAELRGQVQILTEAHTQPDTSVVPNTPPTGHIMFPSSGHQKYVSSDSNAYNTGRLTWLAAGQTINSNTNNYLNPLAGSPTWPISVATGDYRISGYISITSVGATATPVINLNNSAGFAGFRIVAKHELGPGSGTNALFAGSGNNTSFTGALMGSGATNYHLWFFGHVQLTAGTFGVQMSTSAGGSFTVNSLSHVDLMPVT